MSKNLAFEGPSREKLHDVTDISVAIKCILKKEIASAYLLNSMTSLLPHTVAQPTKCRFLPKNLSQLVIFVIELAFT